MSENFDVVIIGAGPGGYVCAIRAAQLGLKVAVVEKRSSPGGTCLNVGCIPSKALLHTSELFAMAGHDFAGFGIDLSATPKVNLSAMMAHKKKVVEGNVQGIHFLFKKNKIKLFNGMATIAGAGVVKIDGNEPKEIHGKAIVIATGSDVMPLPGVEIDEKDVVSSTGALEFGQVPKSMIVVGAGVIGLELGSVWSRLGADVTVVEYLDRILPGMDGEICKQFQRVMQKQGLKFKLGQKVTGAKASESGVELTLVDAKSEKSESLQAEKVLIAIGRRPYTKGLGLEALGIELDKRGSVEVDDHYQTSVKGIYAIGDAIRGPMLAHKAEDEGVALAEILAGKAGHVNYGVIPGVVYCTPELASVGKTEDELKAAGVKYNVGKFNFMANGRAKAMGLSDGLVKILADSGTDRVLGAHIMGVGAGEMIHEVALCMEFGGSSEDMARTCHAHPTLSETIKEAAMDVEKRAIHS